MPEIVDTTQLVSDSTMPPTSSSRITLVTEKTADLNQRTAFGFWVYLMTDCILFAALFATYAVLHNNTNGGPNGRALFNLPYVLAETLILLTSSFSCGLALLALQRHSRRWLLLFLVITFGLGASFLGLELREFHHLANEGNSWQRSGFLSAFFTLVGTHGVHITVGLIWLAVLFQQTVKRGLTVQLSRKIQLFSMFWHFLDVVWIFIFTIVYLLGVI